MEVGALLLCLHQLHTCTFAEIKHISLTPGYIWKYLVQQWRKNMSENYRNTTISRSFIQGIHSFHSIEASVVIISDH